MGLFSPLFRTANAIQLEQDVRKGDAPGHAFRGNQFTAAQATSAAANATSAAIASGSAEKHHEAAALNMKAADLNRAAGNEKIATVHETNAKALRASGDKIAAAPLPGIAKWSTYAGGTAAAYGKRGYSYKHGGTGKTYNIQPVSTVYGRHKGYQLTVWPADKGLHGWIGPDGKDDSNGQGGLHRSPQAAASAANKHLAERLDKKT